MILPYPLRLLCLSLAAFFLVHLVLGLAAWLLAPAALRLAARIRPRAAARLLLCLRLFPVVLALLVVIVLCVPSYLWLEPAAAGEEAGAACLIAALLGLAVWGASIVRASLAGWRSLQCARAWRQSGRPAQLPGEAQPVWLTEGPPDTLALAGILHPRVFVSRAVMDALSAGQLAAALQHEREHRASRDNLKRLLLLLSPELLPWWRPLAPLERGWVKFSEWAADDAAVNGDAIRSIHLAAALVRVARLGSIPHAAPLMNFLLNGGPDLLDRVDRLLRSGPPRRSPAPLLQRIATGSALLALGALIAGMLRPATLSATHSLLERLIR